MDRLSRRNLLPLFCSLAPAANAQRLTYDLIIKGGRVIDPSQSLSIQSDVAVAGNTIAQIAPSIPATEARIVLDARGKIVSPGLIDIHVHVYDGVAPLGVPADPNCIAKGVTMRAGPESNHLALLPNR